MGILTDIYNTVAKFFRSQEINNGEDPSKSVAQNRLKLVLMQDRTNLTPKVLEQMRGEMIDLLSKYLEMDKDLLELNFEQEGDQVALMLSIPVIRAKDEDEIEATLQENSDEEVVDGDENENSESSDGEIVDSEDAPKPRKRRSKKVSAPEDFETNENNESPDNCDNFESQESQQESEMCCENTEC